MDGLNSFSWIVRLMSRSSMFSRPLSHRKAAATVKDWWTAKRISPRNLKNRRIGPKTLEFAHHSLQNKTNMPPTKTTLKRCRHRHSLTLRWKQRTREQTGTFQGSEATWRNCGPKRGLQKRNGWREWARHWKTTSAAYRSTRSNRCLS